MARTSKGNEPLGRHEAAERIKLMLFERHERDYPVARPRIIRCPECNGSGFTSRVVRDAKWGDNEEVDPCKSCDGSGDLADPGNERKKYGKE